MSEKRILPALLLAGSVGFLGLHRIYAGRYLTGVAQLVLFIPGAMLLWKDFAGLEALETLDQAQDWVLNHPIQPLPWLLVSIPSVWAIIDCALLLGRQFRDGSGEKMTQWV